MTPKGPWSCWYTTDQEYYRLSCFTRGGGSNYRIMASGGEQELSLFDLACAKVSQAQQLMSEARELLKKDLDNVKQEKSAFLELTKTLNEVHFGSKVKLNVGGKIYSTTLSTLRKDPDSMLCAMFSGRHELKPDAEDGAYFIDRKGKLFRYV